MLVCETLCRWNSQDTMADVGQKDSSTQLLHGLQERDSEGLPIDHLLGDFNRLAPPYCMSEMGIHDA